MPHRSYRSILWLAPVALGAGLLGCANDSSTAPLVGTFFRAEIPSCTKDDDVPEQFFELTRSFENATYWDCDRLEDGDGEARFISHDAPDAVVSGVPLEVVLDSEDSMAGKDILFWYTAAGFSQRKHAFSIRAEAGSDPIAVAFDIKQHSENLDVKMYFAVVDGQLVEDEPLVIGEIYDLSLYVIPVGSGDIQVNLRWKALVDLDLWVTEPDLTEIGFSNDRSSSGGELDLDSYAACDFGVDSGRGNENIFWETDTAPVGTYAIRVDLFHRCGVSGPIPYSVHLMRDQLEFNSYEAVFDPAVDDAKADEPDFDPSHCTFDATAPESGLGDDMHEVAVFCY